MLSKRRNARSLLRFRALTPGTITSNTRRVSQPSHPARPSNLVVQKLHVRPANSGRDHNLKEPAGLLHADLTVVAEMPCVVEEVDGYANRP